MESAEKLIYIPAGLLLLFIFPVISLLWMKNLDDERMIQNTCKEFVEAAYEQGEISMEDYLYMYEKCLLIDDNRDIKIRIIHLEGRRDAELSDYFYTLEDGELRKQLETGPVIIEKGSMLEIYE